jgi:cytochrome c biogenesis protein CcdA
MVETTLIQIIGLAFVNAINPCALAALVMVLISVLLGNEEKRHKVLLGGFYFITAVFIGYFFYGLIIIQLFQKFAEFMSAIAPYMKYALAVLAIIIGILNIKDYINYKPGGIATEMPLRLRPRFKMIIKSISSPKGAFIAGIFVTIFLLPCTIAPYLIASGNLSALTLINAIPYLLIYNLIFILPMIAITLIVYFGISSAEKVSEWRDRNIKIIHLIAGLILAGLGIGILTKLI